MTQRIYAVRDNRPEGRTRLVRATHPSHAVKHVADSAFSVTVSTQDDLVTLLGLGVAVESIKAEQTELPTT